mgnify:CR=1 FL=1
MYKAGDWVRIRRWEDMKEEFGVDEYGDIKCDLTFVDTMKPLCGLKAIVKDIRGDHIVLHFPDARGEDTNWGYSADMLEPADTLTIEIDPTDKAAAHKAVEDAIAEHQRKGLRVDRGRDRGGHATV